MNQRADSLVERDPLASTVNHIALMGRVTMQTIADEVGVSRMTVSNAFSQPDQLSSELRSRIIAAAERLGYAGPDPVARALARGNSGAIGVLLTDELEEAFSDEVSASFLGAIVSELAFTGLAVTLLTATDRTDVQPARDVGIDGAIVYSCKPRSTARDWLERRAIPLVYVDQDPDAGESSVNVDDRGGARAAAQHLLDLGHQRIGFLGHEYLPGEVAGTHPGHQRLLGWTDALTAAGLSPVATALAGAAPTSFRTAADEVLASNPTAVLCYSDAAAIHLVTVARAAGLEVPRDLSVVGFDDTRAAALHSPALTTVRQDIAAKGRLAASRLVEALEAAREDRALAPHHALLPTSLVVRDSTAPPAA